MFVIDSHYATDFTIIDHFMSANSGNANWTVTTSGGTMSNLAPPDAFHPGTVQCAYVSAATDRAQIRSNVNSIRLGGGTWFIQCLMRIETLSNVTDEYEFHFGFYDSSGATEAVDGVYFYYNRSVSGDFWIGKSSNNSTRTSNVTSSAVTSGVWTRLGIEINADATRAKYFVDGSLVETVTTNIPTATSRVTGISWGFRKTAGTGAANVATIDHLLVRYSQTIPLWIN